MNEAQWLTSTDPQLLCQVRVGVALAYELLKAEHARCGRVRSGA
jgi:hypothetical protein